MSGEKMSHSVLFNWFSVSLQHEKLRITLGMSIRMYQYDFDWKFKDYSWWNRMKTMHESTVKSNPMATSAMGKIVKYFYSTFESGPFDYILRINFHK